VQGRCRKAFSAALGWVAGVGGVGGGGGKGPTGKVSRSYEGGGKEHHLEEKTKPECMGSRGPFLGDRQEIAQG